MAPGTSPHLQVTPLDEAIGAWIALDDAAEDNGCLRYIDGSHRGPALTHAPMPGAGHNAILDRPRPAPSTGHARRCAIVPAGGVAFHHPLTLHSSQPNTSPRPRRAYSSHWVTQVVTCTDHTLEWGLQPPRRARAATLSSLPEPPCPGPSGSVQSVSRSPQTAGNGPAGLDRLRELPGGACPSGGTASAARIR